MIKRWLIAAFFTVTFILSGTGYWLLSTTAGLRFTLQTVVDTVPLPLSYTNLQGSILTSIRADSAQYADEIVTVNLNQFETRFALRPLLVGRLAFSDIKSAEVVVALTNETGSAQVDAKQETPQDKASTDVGLPIVISLENVQIKSVLVKDQEQTIVTVTDIALVDAKIQENFTFTDLSFGIAPAKFSGTGELGFDELAKLKYEGHWETVVLENFPATRGTLKAKGTYQKLYVDAKLENPAAITVNGELNNLFSDMAWTAKVHGSKLPLSVVDAALETELREFKFTVDGGLRIINVAGNSEIWDPQYGKWVAVVNGGIGESKVNLHELKLKSLESPAMLVLAGNTLENFSFEDMGPLQVATSWEKMQWPLTGAPVVASDVGQVEINGSVKDYQVRVTNTALNVEGNKVTKLNANGKGNLEGLKVEKINADYLTGLWQGSGELSWKNDFQWSASISVKGVNPSVQWPEWSAKLGGKANIKGVHKQDDWLITGDVNKVVGELTGLPVDHVSMDFEITENVYTVKNLKFISQQNKLRGALQYKAMPDKHPYVNASWNIDSQNLTQLIPEAKGAVKSEGNLRGELVAPKLSTSIKAQGLSYKDNEISSIDGIINIDPKINSDLNIRLKMERLKLGDTLIRGFSLSGNGTTGDHELRYRSRLDARRSLSWSARGGYKDEVWKGTLNTTLLNSAQFGDWEQQQPSEISVSASRLQIDYYCLTPTNADAHVCIKLDSDYLKSWSGAVNIKDLPVETFETYFPPQIISVQGLVRGTANFRFQEDVIKLFDANLVSEKGIVEFGLPAGEKQKLNYQQLEASITHNNKGISVVSKVDLRETGKVDIQGTLKNKHILSEIDGSQLIEGRVVVDLKNLTVLPLMFPDIQYIDGHKYSEYIINGSIGKPAIVGRSDIAAKSITLPRLGIELRDVKAAARTDKNNNIKVTGEASSGVGRIVFRGEMLNYLGADLLAKLYIEGNNFLATKTPEFEMEISPKVTTIVNNDVMRMEGEITIPRAKIQMIQSASMVSPSTDVVIVDADLPTEKASKRLALDAELKINLGNEVSIEGFGASGRLRGEVLVREKPGEVTTGLGEIRFEEGRFTAYNRELTIETGLLTFANSPIDNPIVAIQAVRRIEHQDPKVKVGVEVTGQAQNPKVELFSEPAMDQSDILSYMILGYPMNQATEKDGSTLSTAASSIGLIGGELLANEIATKLGIDVENIRITTDAATKQPLVGAYLNPKLYAEYVMGVGQAVNTFRIEYNLTNRWVLKTETSSEQQGADLFYTIEVD
jgi:translocation and assembly module TamB